MRHRGQYRSLVYLPDGSRRDQCAHRRERTRSQRADSRSWQASASISLNGNHLSTFEQTGASLVPIPITVLRFSTITHFQLPHLTIAKLKNLYKQHQALAANSITATTDNLGTRSQPVLGPGDQRVESTVPQILKSTGGFHSTRTCSLSSFCSRSPYRSREYTNVGH